LLVTARAMGTESPKGESPKVTIVVGPGTVSNGTEAPYSNVLSTDQSTPGEDGYFS